MKGTEVFRKQLKRGIRKGEKGQSLAEFVLVLPIFLILVFAIIDFGLGFHAWLTVTNSAREGARLGAVRAPAAGGCDNDPSTQAGNIDCRVRETADSLDQAKLSVTITNAQGSPGSSVVVDVDYDYDLITPLDSVLGLISGGSIGPTLQFSSTADMRLE
ncbi:MAG TPA: TadE family protein [Dehalococcoidia bacterium]|jgi:Flp pilus assembly protein TadG|nr:TadE family protein [Dehalococcoidia bacterium]